MTQKWVLGAKLHGLCVTSTELFYSGSIEIPERICEAAGLEDGDVVEVYNIMSGARYRTYVMTGDDGEVTVNGPSARLCQVGDRLVIVQYVLTDVSVDARVLHFDEMNALVDAGDSFGARVGP